jgi:hypothetical protein
MSEKLALRKKNIPLKNAYQFIREVKDPEGDIDENLLALPA